MTLLDKTIIIATNAHAGQVDKGGNLHILMYIKSITKGL